MQHIATGTPLLSCRPLLLVESDAAAQGRSRNLVVLPRAAKLSRSLSLLGPNSGVTGRTCGSQCVLVPGGAPPVFGFHHPHVRHLLFYHENTRSQSGLKNILLLQKKKIKWIKTPTPEMMRGFDFDDTPADLQSGVVMRDQRGEVV